LELVSVLVAFLHSCGFRLCFSLGRYFGFDPASDSAAGAVDCPLTRPLTRPRAFRFPISGLFRRLFRRGRFGGRFLPDAPAPGFVLFAARSASSSVTL